MLHILCVVLYSQKERVVVTGDFSISLCYFSGIKNELDGKAIYLNNVLYNLCVEQSIFCNISTLNNGRGVIYYNSKNANLRCLSFSLISVNYGGSIFGQCSNGLITLCDVTNSVCLHFSCITVYDNHNVTCLNSSNNVASVFGDIRLLQTTKISTNRFIRMDKASSIETLSISGLLLQYIVLSNNNYGNNASGGLLRLSYTSSVIEYASIFWNSGSYFVTFYQASCSISHCYTNEAQSQFSGCTLVSDFHEQCSTFTEYHSIQSTCPTHFVQSNSYLPMLSIHVFLSNFLFL